MENIERLYGEWQRCQPLKEEFQRRLDRKFMLEFNYNSNHLEGNTLTYGQTEMLLLFGKVTDSANMKDLEDMKASNVALNMMKEEAASDRPLTETFIRQLHKTLMREDYTVYRQLPGGRQTSYVVHAGVYKTRPNSVITATGERFEYASPEETSALMNDLITWYREEEGSGRYSPVELGALFHFRYIRIHPFEDGNGRIARLLVNFIMLRHNYPMIVVKSADKENYLTALSKCDVNTGETPSVGAHARLEDIQPLVAYIGNCTERALNTCIKAAKGLSIEEDDDFTKELKILERQKRQEIASKQEQAKFSADEVRNVLEYVYFPIVEEFDRAIDTTKKTFDFIQSKSSCIISKNKSILGIIFDDAKIRTPNPIMSDYLNNVQTVWYSCELIIYPRKDNYEIKKEFYIAFFEDHYFLNGILNKNFPYGHYPTEVERQEVISQFKEGILQELKEKL